jgi:hypothetical protein
MPGAADWRPAGERPTNELEADLAQEPGGEGAQTVDPLSALDPVPNRVLGQHVKTVFNLWVVVFALVGAQMGWVLRPFIGNPDMPFAWFRGRESNFFQAIPHTFQSLFS